MSWRDFGFKPYVPVAQRQQNAKRQLAKALPKTVAQPVHIEGRTIASSFWGKAWCINLESYMDYANRLPRGRTYVRNGSVLHLDVQPGQIHAKVCGSELYTIKIQIQPLAPERWKGICTECAGGIGSLVELLQARLSDRVMEIMTRKGTGLFPSPREIKMSCSCPDSAGLCKHLAAVLYGIGARLDQSPELLFALRSVNHDELISHATAATELSAKATAGGPELSETEMSSVFGIELDNTALPATAEQLPPSSPGKGPKRSVPPRRSPKPKAAPRSNPAA